MTKNPHLSDDDVFESLDRIIPDTLETRLVGLIEACKIIQVDLNLGRIEEAKELLAFALTETEKTWRKTDLKKALVRYLPPGDQ
ncbi:hypothetical protein [Nostoc sp. UHCC 0252]|uniref:hypothetical protein n=1 Tax=Nostoc sp. UHCC 0252 TaxID=3110241 RepID=UPI002B1F0C84|nr:hypothetical protein [Nostoc sp. UHCC 0252]MEA5601067.1 hypothetical protein [Nostoc sp. UHCC 0252]